MIGAEVGGYKILGQLGEGGMGAVYLARHQTLGRPAAIKVLLPKFSTQREFVQRFFNEARSTAQIRHPGLVDVYDFGQLADGSAFLVMEMLEGEALQSRLEREQTIPLAAAIGIARQVASAVGAAHDHGVIHRDLKPDNVFLVPDADMPLGTRVKVLDFGIAKLVSDPDVNVRTVTLTQMGTPGYMSPEQCRDSSKVDQRSDVYALGCILFHMVCGQMPFQAPSYGDLMAAQIRDPPPRPRHLSVAIPIGLEDLILRLLEKAAEARPQSMAEVVNLLDEVAREPNARLLQPTLAPSSSMKTILAPISVGPDSPHTPAGQREAGPKTALLPPPGVRPTTTMSSAAGETSKIGPRRAAPTVAFLLLGIPAATIWLVYRQPALEPAVPDARPSPVVAVPPIPPPSVAAKPDAPIRVHARVESIPAGASLYRRADGVKIGETPFEAFFGRENGSLPVVVKLKGYGNHDVDVSLRTDTIHTLTLQRAPKTKKGPRLADPFNDN